MEDTLTDLISQCASALRGDEDLNVAIFRTLCPEYAGTEWQPYGGGMRHVYDSSDARCIPTQGRWLKYTSCVDAAITLVPQGWEWWVNGRAYARVWLPGDLHEGPREISQSPQCATPALALTVAALGAMRIIGEE